MFVYTTVEEIDAFAEFTGVVVREGFFEGGFGEGDAGGDIFGGIGLDEGFDTL